MTKSLTVVAAIAAAMIAASQPAQARHQHHWPRHYARHHQRHYADSRPRAWCGWYMRRVLGVADPRYNQARAWARYGSNAGGPGYNVIVVWPHHVGRIVGRGPNGGWIINSGNDGHRVRTRERSLHGAIAFRAA